MGATRWIKFASKKSRDKAKNFLSETRIIYDDEIVKEGISVFLEWSNDSYVLEVSYSCGSSWNEAFSAFVQREISRRFKISRIGADSVGWYDDKDWKYTGLYMASSRYGPYKSWKDWARGYKPEWSHEFRNDRTASVITSLRQIEMFTVDFFLKLDTQEK